MSNRLPVLTEEIRRAHADVQEADKTAAEHAIEAGHSLIEAKSLVKHGQWLPWLKELGIPERTARRYITLARGNVKPAIVADIGIARAERFISVGLRYWPESGQARQGVGYDNDDLENGFVSVWYTDSDGIVHWMIAYLIPGHGLVHELSISAPLILGVVLEPEIVRFDQFQHSEISIDEASRIRQEIGGAA